MGIAEIRLRKPRRILYFKCKDELALEKDQACVVMTEQGMEYGVCTTPPDKIQDGRKPGKDLRVMRKAGEADEKTYDRVVSDEERALKLCKGKILDRRLPMKLIDAVYTFDRHKVIFFFTAEDRVDFRELVKDLAHELRTRIEMRHIQVRDEAKMVGGIGPCGRQLCCSSWLSGFMPISMKMAKRQNLSLNPSKISGQCGRLMCCLSYENDQYGPPKKRTKAKQPNNQKQYAKDGAPEPDSCCQSDCSGCTESQAAPPAKTEQRTPDKTNTQNAAPADGKTAEGSRRTRKRRRRRRRKPGSGEASNNQGQPKK